MPQAGPTLPLRPREKGPTKKISPLPSLQTCLLPFTVATAAASALYFSYYMRYMASKPALSYVRTKVTSQFA
eukprot:8170977-Pyramimonas_sp.AAC.2